MGSDSIFTDLLPLHKPFKNIESDPTFSELGGFQRADLGRDCAAREAPEPQLPEPAFGFLPAIAPSGRGELVHHHREDGGLGRSGQAVVQEELHDENLSAWAERVPHPLEQGAILLLVEVMDHVRYEHSVVAGPEVGCEEGALPG